MIRTLYTDSNWRSRWRVPPLRRSPQKSMEDIREHGNTTNPTMASRFRGIGIVLAIYAAQLFALNAIRVPLQQSVILPVIALCIVAAGWLASGLILGATVMSRSWGGMRFAVGLGAALLLTLLLVVGVIEYLNNLPPTYNGP